MRLILYNKPGCHLCEGLQTKLEQVQSLQLSLEIRDITTREDWFQAYQYEIPVLYAVPEVEPEKAIQAVHPSRLILIPRISARASVKQIEQVLQKFLLENPKNEAE
jgi:hypothetical protein